MKPNQWYPVRNLSLAVFTRDAGFDLSIYDSYSEATKKELRKRSIKNAVYAIGSELEDDGVDIKNCKTGVYVISLSNSMTLKYGDRFSSVIYVGMGNIIGRLESHFTNSLFDFMQSLSGADFDFQLAKPELLGEPHYYKHVEYLMLENFRAQNGCLPILNQRAGANKKIQNPSDWWKSPLRNNGRRPRWALEPTNHAGFARLSD